MAGAANVGKLDWGAPETLTGSPVLRFAANLSMLFTELPFGARFAAARMAGFAGVEFLFPYDHDAGALRSELAGNGLVQVLFNLPPGDWEAGERGMAAIPGKEADFEAGLETALAYAEALDCRLLHVMAGVLPPDITPGKAMATYVANLRRAAHVAAEHGVTLVIEPINHRDMPGYFLSRTESARRAIESVGADNLGLQLDLYHRQTSEGDLVTAIRDNIDITRHVQIANLPGRREPGSGEIDYGYIFQVLREVGYDGWIGCEYHPHGATRESLGWFEPYRSPRRPGAAFNKS
jgi:2-dehydrotetronate isomerase